MVMQPAPKLFRASATVALDEPGVVLQCLCARFAEWGKISVQNGKALIETGFGQVSLEGTGTTLTLAAEAADETGLAFVKLSMAEHLLALHACKTCPRIVWQGDGAAGSPLPYFREMEVAAVRDVTPGMRRITLRGENLARFAEGGFHVRLLFCPQGAEKPCWPVTGEDGRPQWPEGPARPVARIYTIRRIDAEKGELDIDIVLHGGKGEAHGPGASFAVHAKPGDRVGMTGPGGGTLSAADRYLLAGDETALPAICRILRALPASAQATVLLEVADEGEEQPLRSEAQVDLRWLHRNGAAPGTTTLLPDAVREYCPRKSPDDRIFAWVGCEAASFRAIRQFLRADQKLSREEHLAVAYWRRGFAGEEARKTD